MLLWVESQYETTYCNDFLLNLCILLESLEVSALAVTTNTAPWHIYTLWHLFYQETQVERRLLKHTQAQME